MYKRSESEEFMKLLQKVLLLSLVLLLGGCMQKEEKLTNGCDGECSVDFSAEAQKQVEIYRKALQEGNFKESNFQEIKAKADANESFYVVYGFETCPWCQQLFPVLADVSIQLNKEILYVPVRDKENVDLRVMENEGYKSNFELVKDLIQDKIYVPALFKFENGKAVQIHEGTVEGHNAKERMMTEEELKACYQQVEDLLK